MRHFQYARRGVAKMCDMPTFIVDSGMWDEGDYVVTIRPDWEKPWHDLPIGMALSDRDAQKCAQWLRTALPELWRIFNNLEKEKNE